MYMNKNPNFVVNSHVLLNGSNSKIQSSSPFEGCHASLLESFLSYNSRTINYYKVKFDIHVELLAYILNYQLKMSSIVV